MKAYDFNALQNNTSMTWTEILEEYAYVQQELRKTDEMPLGDEFYRLREPLDEAEHYLAFIICAKCCKEHGIEIF